MVLEHLSWIFAAGVGLAAGSVVIFGLSVVAELLFSFGAQQRALRFYRRRLRPKDEEQLQRQIGGGVSWPLLSLACGFLALWVALFLASRLSYGLVGLLVGGGLPLLVWPTVKRRRTWRVKVEIRDFLSGLRLALAIRPTISLALEAASAGMSKGLFAERLRYHVKTRLLTEGAEAVIRRLAQEFHSKEVEGLLVRIEAARKGGLPLPEALRRASEEMERELIREAEYAVESAPVRLTFPLLLTLFPPLLLFIALPLVWTLLENLGALR